MKCHTLIQNLAMVLLFSGVTVNTLTAQSFKQFVEQGDEYAKSGQYEKAERQYQAAKLCTDAKKSNDTRIMLDGKIDNIRKRRIEQLEQLNQSEKREREKAEQLQRETEIARRDATSQALALRIRSRLTAKRETTKAMHLTAFGMQCIDPGNPIFLLEFMDEFNSQLGAPGFHPIPFALLKEKNTTNKFGYLPKSKHFVLSQFSAPFFKAFALDDSGEIQLIDSNTAILTPPYFIAYTQNETLLASNNMYKPEQIFILALKDGAFSNNVDTLNVGDTRMTNLALLKNSTYLLVSYPDSLNIWDIKTKSLKYRVADPNQQYGTNRNPVLVSLKNYFGWSNREILQLWNYASGEPVPSPFFFKHSSQITDVITSKDEKTIITGATDGNIKVWNISTGLEIRNLQTADKLLKISLSEDGRWLATGHQNGQVSVWDMETGKELYRLPFSSKKSSIAGLQFTQGAQRLLVAYGEGETCLYNLNTKAIIKNLYPSKSDTNYDGFSVQEIADLNLYEILKSMPWGMDSLINSRDNILMNNLAAYLINLIRTEQNLQRSTSYFEDAERLFLHSGDTSKLSNLYYLWSKALLENNNIPAASKFIKKAMALGESDEKLRLLNAHIQLLSGAFEKSIHGYLSSLTVNAKRSKEVDNGKLVESFQGLSISGIWKNDRKKQLDVERALRIIGVPLSSNPSLAPVYGVYPLQSPKSSLGDLIQALKGKDSLTADQIDHILSLYTYEVEQVIRPKRRKYSIANNYTEAIKAAEIEIGLLQEIYSVNKSEEIKIDLGQTQGSYSYYLLFTQQYQQAQEAGIAGFENSAKYWVKTNLGHAYLLAGEKEKALEIYLDIKDRPDDTSIGNSKSTLKDALLIDFKDLVKYGIRNPNIPEIAALLLERPLTEEERQAYGAEN